MAVTARFVHHSVPSFVGLRPDSYSFSLWLLIPLSFKNGEACSGERSANKGEREKVEGDARLPIGRERKSERCGIGSGGCDRT